MASCWPVTSALPPSLEGSAFLCADLELTPEIRDDHAAYIASWLQALKNDKRLIVQTASHAQLAVKFLHDQQPNQPAPLIDAEPDGLTPF